MTKKRVILFPQICAHAKALGVTREHLYRVLTGARDSRELMVRYHALLAGAHVEPQTYKPKSKVLIGALQVIADNWAFMKRAESGKVAREALVEAGVWKEERNGKV